MSRQNPRYKYQVTVLEHDETEKDLITTEVKLFCTKAEAQDYIESLDSPNLADAELRLMKPLPTGTYVPVENENVDFLRQGYKLLAARASREQYKVAMERKLVRELQTAIAYVHTAWYYVRQAERFFDVNSRCVDAEVILREQEKRFTERLKALAQAQTERKRSLKLLQARASKAFTKWRKAKAKWEG